MVAMLLMMMSFYKINPAMMADESAVGAMNRPLRAWPDYFVKAHHQVVG